MPIYEYRCADCRDFDQIFGMDAVPDEVICPTCDGRAHRRISAPNISVAGSAAFRLIDSTKRSAHEPAVVNAPRPEARTGAGQGYSANPMHRKLPRP